MNCNDKFTGVCLVNRKDVTIEDGTIRIKRKYGKYDRKNAMIYFKYK